MLEWSSPREGTGRGGGRGAEGSLCPQVRRYRKLLLEKCLCSLREPSSTSVPSEAMEALAKVLAELRDGDMGSFFDAISEQCRAFFDHVSPQESLAGPGPQWGLRRCLPRTRVSTSEPPSRRCTGTCTQGSRSDLAPVIDCLILGSCTKKKRKSLF